MGRKANLHPHLTIEELKTGYLNCRDAAEARRWQLLWFVAQGRPIRKAARLVGFCQSHAYDFVSQYNRQGPVAFKDGRALNQIPRTRSLLKEFELEQLQEALKQPPPDGGLWTGPKVAQWIALHTGKATVYPQRGWDYLKKLEGRVRVPRRRHAKADQAAQEVFKKKEAKRGGREGPARAPRSSNRAMGDG